MQQEACLRTSHECCMVSALDVRIPAMLSEIRPDAGQRCGACPKSDLSRSRPYRQTRDLRSVADLGHIDSP